MYLIYFKLLREIIQNSNLLESIKPLLNTKTLWKPHALLLLGDYYVSKEEYIKAKEFYQEIFIIKNLHNDLYKQAGARLSAIANE